MIKYYEHAIVESPLNKSRLAICSFCSERGEWAHKDDVEKYLIDKQSIKEAIVKVLKEQCDEIEWQDHRFYFTRLEEELGLEE